MVTPMRCASVFLLIVFALALNSQLLAQAPNRRLEIEQTSAGPVVRGMFDRFEQSAMPECGTCHCSPGSNTPPGLRGEHRTYDPPLVGCSSILQL